MKNIKLGLVLIFSMAAATYGQGYFTLIGPQTHQLGKPYRAHLVASGYKNARDIKISLNHEDYKPSGEIVRLTKDFEREISIDFVATTNISELTLKAEYTDDPGTIFKQTIKVIAKKYSVLVQTDKAVYKPGDKVQFRVIVLDADLKPYPYNSLNVAISDGAKQKVAGRSASRSEFSVYEDSLQLADELNFGKWAILVVVDGKKSEVHKQNFEVVDYQLPQFEVVVDVVAKDVLLSAGQIRGEIYAKYAFANSAKFVKGAVTLTAKTFDPNYPERSLTSKIIQTSGSGDKKAFTVNLVRDLNLQGQLNQTFVKLEATFKDDLTKRSLIGSTNVIIHKNADFSIEILDGKKFMIPGHPYRFKIKVNGFDGKVVQGNKKLTILGGAYVDLKKCGENKKRKLGMKVYPKQEKILNNGVAEVTFNVPTNAEAVLLNFKFGNETIGEHKFFRHYTKTGENLDLKVTSSLKSGQDINIKVLSSHGMKKLHSVIVGRSGIVHTQSDNVARMQNFDLRFKATPAMLPSSKLIVYYIQSTGEVVYDQVELKFDTWTGNSVAITAPESVEPGVAATVSVQTLPKSFVGLMAVDRRSSFLATGNDIDESRMQAEISSFTFSDVYNKSHSSDLYSFLSEANAVILTDANKGSPDCTEDRFGDQYDLEVDEIPETSRKMRSFDQQSPTGFPETWIFQSGLVDKDGYFDLQETVPQSITSYVISAFSVNPEVGFGLAAPAYLGVSKDFFVEVHLPSSAFIEDIIKVEVFVFNYESGTRKTKVTVKLQNDEEFDILASKSGSSCSLASTEKSEMEVEVVHDGVSKAHFFIKPKKAGLLKITASAQLNRQTGHSSSQSIFVEETGLKEGNVKAKIFDLRKQRFDSVFFNMGSSDDAADGSEKLEAFVSGNVMGSMIDAEIYGSDGSTGEKLLSYVSAAYSLQYLKATGQSRQIQGALPAIESAYQLVLSRKLSGSNRGYIEYAGDEKASLLATAQVAKFLAIIKDYVSIQDVNLVSALEFLKNKQSKTTGEFVIEDTSSEAFQDSSSKSVTDTAMIALAFLENTPYVPKYKGTIKKALDFINSKFADAKNDEYALAISAYALAASGEEDSAQKFIDELYKTANRDKVYIFWNGTSSSQQILTAAYTILALEKLDRIVEAPNILNWLLTRRDENGGFQSSEDTVVGIQAIAAMAVHFHSDYQNLNLYIYNEELFKKIPIYIDDTFMPQTYSIPTPSGATVNANGTGTAFVQMTQKYYKKSDHENKFSVSAEARGAENNLRLAVCIKRLSGQPGAVVAEVRLPGGFEFNENTFDKSKVKSVFTRKNKSFVILTLDKVQTLTPYCVDINAVSFYTVTSATSIPIKVYDQQDKVHYNVKFYSLPTTRIC